MRLWKQLLKRERDIFQVQNGLKKAPESYKTMNQGNEENKLIAKSSANLIGLESTSFEFSDDLDNYDYNAKEKQEELIAKVMNDAR